MDASLSTPAYARMLKAMDAVEDAEETLSADRMKVCLNIARAMNDCWGRKDVCGAGFWAGTILALVETA